MSENTQHTPVLKPHKIGITSPTEALILKVFLALIFIAAGIAVLNIGYSLLLESTRLTTAQATVLIFAGIIKITLGKLGVLVTFFSLLMFFSAYRIFSKNS